MQKQKPSQRRSITVSIAKTKHQMKVGDVLTVAKVTKGGIVLKPRVKKSKPSRATNGHAVARQGKRQPQLELDPIFEFGKHPVRTGISDASMNLDKYLYHPTA